MAFDGGDHEKQPLHTAPCHITEIIISMNMVLNLQQYLLAQVLK